MTEICGVLVVAAVRVYREGLVRALAEAPGMTATGAGPHLADALCALDPAPDVVLLDSGLPEGPAAVRLLTGRCPGARIVAVGLPEEPVEVVRWAEAGVAG